LVVVEACAVSVLEEDQVMKVCSLGVRLNGHLSNIVCSEQHQHVVAEVMEPPRAQKVPILVDEFEASVPGLGWVAVQVHSDVYVTKEIGQL
jgi:hypothetical protein